MNAYKNLRNSENIMSQANELKQLSQRLQQFAQDRDWEQFHNPKNLSMALIAECAELVEHFQWLSIEQSQNLEADKHQEVAMELADIFIYLIRIADQLDIDLLAVANQKTTINAQRYPVDKVKGSAKRAEEY